MMMAESLSMRWREGREKQEGPREQREQRDQREQREMWELVEQREQREQREEPGQRTRRAPRIGDIPRHSAIEEEEADLAIQLGGSPGPSPRLRVRGGPPLNSLGESFGESLGERQEGEAARDLSCDAMGRTRQAEGQEGWSETGKAGMSTRSSFAAVIEETKGLSLSEERQRSPTHRLSPGQSPRGPSPCLSPLDARVPPIALHRSPGSLSPRCQSPLVDCTGETPVPAKCSSQLKRLIQCQAQSVEGLGSAAEELDHAGRPIYPNLPYSPYTSPCSSPRVKRKPLKETKRVSSEQNGDYVQLNQYKLQGVVGQGSYGIVKLAYNDEDNTNYAMKILSKKKLRKKAGIFGRAAPNRKGSGGASIKKAENPLDKVYREIAIMKKLDHPNVVKLVEVVDDPEEDNLYMVFELLERGEVLEIPADKPLKEEEAWKSFRDVLLGLEYLHYQKIIHRDIKPSNLLRADSGEVKIADLGVSNEFDGADAFLTSTAGTPAFTAPESLSQQPGEPPYSGRLADIWSLGVTLYCLVFGRIPFEDMNILSLYNKIRTQPLKIPEDSDVSGELQDLLHKMLVKDPQDRITLAEIKDHDWVTMYDLKPMLKEEENCQLIEVTEHEVQNSVRSIPKLDTLILVKPEMSARKKMSFEERDLKKDLKKLSFSSSLPPIPPSPQLKRK